MNRADRSAERAVAPGELKTWEKRTLWRKAWYEETALAMGLPYGCQGAESCPGWTWQWFGRFDTSDPDSGWVHRPCEVGDHATRWAARPTNPDRGTWERPLTSRAGNVAQEFYHSLLDGSGLPKRGPLGKVTLDSYATTANGKHQVYKGFLEWAKREWLEGPRRKGALLVGNLGVGKTGLAVALGRETLARHSTTVLYMNVSDFVNQVSHAWATHSGEEYNLMEKMKQKRLLILNDLGAGHGTAADWGERSPMRYLFEILDYRYDHELPTVVTTNLLSKAELVNVIGERNTSRLFANNDVFPFTGAVDLRSTEPQTDEVVKEVPEGFVADSVEAFWRKMSGE